MSGEASSIIGSKPRGRAREVVGLIGWPARHSLSPPLMNRVFSSRGLALRYMPFEVSPSELAGAVARFLSVGLRGFNVTIPHKERMAELVGELSSEAALLGAVNCVERTTEGFRGHNTDWQAFGETLDAAGFNIRGSRTVILGAGGAARAVAFCLAAGGAEEIVVLGRSHERAGELVGSIGRAIHRVSSSRRSSGEGEPASELAVGEAGKAPALKAGLLAEREAETVAEEISTARLLVNATPVGMKGTGSEECLPLADAGALHADLLVYDLIYRPRETALLREARKRGARVTDGLPMLAYQAAAAFRLWTGKEIAGSEMLALAQELLCEPGCD